MTERPSQFVQALAERLFAAFKSTFVPELFSDVLGDVHTNGWESEAERAAWEAVAGLIVDHRDEVEVGQYLDHQQSVQ